MYLLYELGVQLSRLAERKRAASTEPTDRE
jgi:Sec-independent protein secretion pathway component TatC